mgnify:CR=1 FL=1
MYGTPWLSALPSGQTSACSMTQSERNDNEREITFLQGHHKPHECHIDSIHIYISITMYETPIAGQNS